MMVDSKGRHIFPVYYAVAGEPFVLGDFQYVLD